MGWQAWIAIIGGGCGLLWFLGKVGVLSVIGELLSSLADCLGDIDFGGDDD